LASSTAKPAPVFVITGTSGAGKGTLEKPLLERMPELELAVSATTRARRPNEREGREYYFVSADEFQRRVDANEFIEHVMHPWGPRHGTLRSEIERIRGAGRIPVLDLETEGALVVRDEVPGAVTIFVRAPSFDELERRLRERATESEGEIEERLARARARAAGAGRRVRLRDRQRRPGPRRGRARRHRRAGVAVRGYHSGMIHPRIDELLENVDSRYALVIVAAKRARQINNYHHQLGEGMGFEEAPPPLVESRSKNYLTMALEEISEGKLKYSYSK
jgi:guanylate kinase